MTVVHGHGRQIAMRRLAGAVLAGALVAGSGVVAAGAAYAGPAPVTVTQSAAPSPVASGDQLTYTITTKNTGGAKVNDVVLTDVFNGLTGADGVGGLTISSDVGSCTQSGQEVRCTAGTLAGGQTWTVTVRGTVTGDAGTTLNNTATVTGTKSAQTFSVTNTLSTQIVAQGAGELADLSVSVTAPSTTPPESDYLYQLIVNNQGAVGTTDVALSATIPPTVAFLAAEPTSLFACTHSGEALGGTVSCTGGAVNDGANATIRLGVKAPASSGSSVTLTTAVDPFDTIPESNETNNAVQATTQITNAPPADSLALTKTDGPDPIAPYMTLKYVSTMTNTSSSRADYITFTDGTQGLEASSISVVASAVGTAVQPTCTVAAPTVTCEITRFQPGAVMTVEIQGLVTQSPGSTIINTATVNGNIKNTGLTSTASTITTVRPARDLTITQARTFPAPPTPVRAADRFDYSLVVGNSGLFGATNVLVRQPLPSGVVFDHVAFSGLGQAGVSCSVDVDNVLSCELASVGGITGSQPQGGTVAWTIPLIAPQAVGPITSTATADPANAIAENDESNNTVVTTTQVLTGIDLVVDLTELHDPIARNGTQTYTMKVSNVGTQDTAGVVVRNVLPVGSRFRTAQGDHGFTCSASEQVVTCLGGIIEGTYSGMLTEPVDVATITIDVFAQDEPGIAHDEVRVDPEGTVDEIDESNNLDVEDGVVGNGETNGAYLNLLFDPITANHPVIATSGTLDYLVPVRNTGSADAYQVVATVTLPEGSTYLSASDTSPGAEAFQCSAEGQVVTCTGATIRKSPDLGRTIAIKTFAPATPGTATIQAALDPANAIGESNESDNKASLTTLVESGSANGVYNDLRISSLTTNHNPIVPDGQLQYAVTVENFQAQATAFGVDFRAVLPPGARFRSADDQGGTTDAFSCALVDSNIVECTGAKIDPGAARTVHIAVFAPSQPGSYRLDAFVDPNASIPEGNEGNNAAEKSVDVTLSTSNGSYIDLQVSALEAKSMSATLEPAGAVTEVTPGQTYFYEMKVVNTGPGEAINVPFRFVAPTGVEVLDAYGDAASNFLCQVSGSVVSCTGGYVKPSSADPRTILVKVKAPLSHNLQLRSTAAVDPDDAIAEDSEINNVEQLTTTVRSLVDLDAGNSWSGGSGGSSTTFTGTVANLGTADAFDVVMRVSAPVGTIIENAQLSSNEGWSCSVYENPVNEVVCTGTKLAAGATQTVTISVYVTSEDGPTSSTTVVDPDDRIVESDELNNSEQGTS